MRAKCSSVGAPGALALPPTRSRLCAPVATALLLCMNSPAVAQAPAVPVASPPASQPVNSAAAHPYTGHVAEAARRFGIPESWIWSVMRVESAGDPTATSHAGAMGLMQVMPGTYAELRDRYGLGPNAYDPRNSILAGAAYLREMHDRYGSAGFLAAYNAGPGRWEDYVSRGRPLPAETVAYMARLGPLVGGSAAPSPSVAAQVDRFAWRRATLFVVLSADVPAAAPPELGSGIPADRLQGEAPSTSDAIAGSSARRVGGEARPAVRGRGPPPPPLRLRTPMRRCRSSAPTWSATPT